MTGPAERLLAARASGDHCPEWLNGSIDLHQALELQLAVLEDQLTKGEELGGWKVGLTSESARRRLGADERPFGFVLARRTLGPGTELAAAKMNRPSIETEMCFTMGRDVPADITPDRVLDHVSTVQAGFELNEQRQGSVQPDFCAMVTDCLTNWGIVAGPGVAPADAEALSATVVSMERDGEEVFRGVSRDFVDDHTVSLCRLADQLGAHGHQLRAGQKIITGAFARFPAEAGQHWRATYQGIGSVDINII